MTRSHIYLDGRDLERDQRELMRFHLTYQGDLLSSQPPKDGDGDKRGPHKHHIRRCFHRQLKRYWETQRWLKSVTMDAGYRTVLPEGAAQVFAAHPGKELPMSAVLGEIYGHNGYQFTPLVWKEAETTCSLRFLVLRRDGDSAVSAGRDIDNRIKTVIDALTVPFLKYGSPRDMDGKILSPQDDETPLFVLLDDDRQVTHLEVETDALLDAPPGSSEAYVQLSVLVEIRPYHTNMFNLSFA